MQTLFLMHVQTQPSPAVQACDPYNNLPRLLQAFSLFSIVIDRLQEEVRPFVAGILQLLPELWSDADGQPLMRIQVHSRMTHTCMTCLLQRHLVYVGLVADGCASFLHTSKQ
jgi:hypothetical protein